MSRLAAFDMDGTLLLPSHRLGEETLASLRALKERDVILAFATGRHFLEMKLLAAQLALDAWLITGNGTRVHNMHGETLHTSDLPADIAWQVIHTAWDTQATLHVFNDDGWFTAQPVPEILMAHQMERWMDG